VSDFTDFTQCSAKCGNGIKWRTRKVTQQPSAGAFPCPTLNDTEPCNNGYCTESLGGYGYVAWGPWTGPATLTYNVASYNGAIDIFVFSAANYYLYQQDAALPKPYGTGYTAVRAMLNTDNAQDTVDLAADTQYYLVVDNTPIGGANGNNGVFNAVTFNYNFEFTDTTAASMVEIGTPYNTNPTSSASLVSPSLLALVVCLLAWVL